MPCPLPNFSQSDYLIQAVDMNSHTEWQTVQIQISWLLKKPTDLDLHCLQKQGISGFSRTWVKGIWYFFPVIFFTRETTFLILCCRVNQFPWKICSFTHHNHHTAETQPWSQWLCKVHYFLRQRYRRKFNQLRYSMISILLSNCARHTTLSIIMKTNISTTCIIIKQQKIVAN